MDTLQAGIIAAREGRQAEARALLQQVLQADPRSEQGWLWMSAVVETDAERRTCLERVLSINPYNQTAQARLEKLSPVDSPVTDLSTGQNAGPTSPHSMPTLGMDPVAPGSRRIRRLAPQAEPEDELARLRAAQIQPPAPSPEANASQSDPYMALILIGGLSVTAIGGALMLAILWLIGWPP